MIETLEKIDRDILLFVNGLHNDFFDSVMWWISSIYAWIPVYAFFLYLLIKKYKVKAVFLIILAVITVIAADKISVVLFKNVFERYRPTHNLEIKEFVHIVNGYTGGLYGFVSSHAANGFAIATIMSLFYRKKIFIYSVFLWVAIVCYSRMYLGVHYLSDIVCGGISGSIIAFLFYYIFNYFFSKKYPGWNTLNRDKKLQ